MDKIVAAFAAVGMVLDFFPAEGDWRESWQYDGFNFNNNTLVQLYQGVNGLGRPAVFGDYTSESGQSYDLSSCKADWLENFGQHLAAMSRGEDW
jgi:hypothetical protein